jgi:hypothetical protein
MKLKIARKYIYYKDKHRYSFEKRIEGEIVTKIQSEDAWRIW